MITVLHFSSVIKLPPYNLSCNSHFSNYLGDLLQLQFIHLCSPPAIILLQRFINKVPASKLILFAWASPAAYSIPAHLSDKRIVCRQKVPIF